MPKKISQKPKIKKEKKEKEEKEEKKEVLPKPEIPKKTELKEHYFEAVGRRKTAVARVRIFTKGEKTFLINNKPYNVYFPTLALQQTALGALEKMKCVGKFRIQVLVKGGGISAQAEAVRHGIARALILFNPDFKKRLKRAGFLKRDPRMRERKKFGLKRARRAPQWQKR